MKIDYKKINLNSIITNQKNIPSSKKCEEDEESKFMISQKNLYRIGNHIYLFDEIDDRSQIFIQTEMAAAYKELMTANVESLSHGSEINDTIFIHINSCGGLVSSSLAIYDYIKSFPIPVVGVVEGIAASGASIILCACAIRQATKHSHVLIHELRSGNYGKYSELVDDFINNKTFMSELEDIYTKETLIPKEDLKDILSHDTFWDAETCKKLQIIDFIVGENPDAAELEKRVALRLSNEEVLNKKDKKIEKKKTFKNLKTK